MDVVLKRTLYLSTKKASFLCCTSNEGYWKRMCGISQIESKEWRVRRGKLLKDNLKEK